MSRAAREETGLEMRVAPTVRISNPVLYLTSRRGIGQTLCLHQRALPCFVLSDVTPLRKKRGTYVTTKLITHISRYYNHAIFLAVSLRLTDTSEQARGLLGRRFRSSGNLQLK